jgi:hypothetical protein
MRFPRKEACTEFTLHTKEMSNIFCSESPDSRSVEFHRFVIQILTTVLDTTDTFCK